MRRILSLLILVYSLSWSQSNSNRHSFFQPNNINTVFVADGTFNYDRFAYPGSASFIWPVTSTTSLTAEYTTGILTGAKVGQQRELRVAGCWYSSSHFTPGNIPVIGQVPPQSVCNDTSWTVYLVNLNDQSLVNGGSRTKVAGGRTYTFYYSSWAQWPIAKGAAYAEINGIPGYQPDWNGDRPGIGNGSKVRPEEICFTVFMDFTNCTNDIHPGYGLPGGTLPLSIQIHQITFAFNCPVLNNILFMKYQIINKSSLQWDSAYVSIINDADIGDAFNDAGGSDSIRNMSFTYNKAVIDPVYGANPPGLGTRFLQMPLVHGSNNDTVYLPYDTLIGFKMIRMKGSYSFVNGNECNSPPDEAFRAYFYMQGRNGCGETITNHVTGNPTTFMYSGNACTQTGWIDSNYFNLGHDVRYLQTTGPFNMNSGDTQIVVASFIITRDGGTNFQNVCALQSLSDSALKYYYNDFRTCIPIGIEPISNEVPDRFMLYQNYPNPFNPVTSIRFQVAGYRQVKIVIYDALGREIVTLVNEELKPGTYEVEWLAENYPSGVYFYQLTAPGFTQTNKMVLLK